MEIVETNVCDRGVSSEANHPLPKKIVKRPNFFVALRLNDPSLHSIVDDIQDEICSYCPDLARHMTTSKKLHLTFFVMHLETASDKDKASQCLQDCLQDIESIFPSSRELNTDNPTANSLIFKRLKSFGKRVLYLSPEESPQLVSLTLLVERCYSRFVAAGLLNEEGSESSNKVLFTPHATVAKIAHRPRGKGSVKLSIEKKYWNDLQCPGSVSLQEGFTTTVKEIDLLSMMEKDSDGVYYRSYSQICLP
mmetsp:Transcript_18090/g.18151  ORF Transcript_18090/g.18151 Transcript_18090/m.18151 type:complete len:250 (+) Transcript_18090:248-997(+)